MKAIILAAGRGYRLGLAGEERPKVLLQFGGRSLLQRHFEILDHCGVDEVAVVVGYRADAIRDEIAALGRARQVSVIENPRYAEGSVLSLWSAASVLTGGGPVLLMDGDVLYDWRLLDRLVRTRIANCLLMDRKIEPGDEPVKLCIAQDRIVDFHKRPQQAHDWHGESVGFFRLSEQVAGALCAAAGDYVGGGRQDQEYEEPLRDLILAAPAGLFGFEDISDLPWTEIDFPADVARARAHVLPRLTECAQLGVA